MTLPCGCCATAAEARATHGANRPWLSAIDYRLGTFASFREAILDELAATPALSGLRSRIGDDYAITAVELWAAVADVLTFYTERMANEAFLRTATLRDSVLRLARILDYQLSPGAAATTALAFTLERDAVALIPARTRVQSVPGEGETAQKFETLEAIAARAALNRLRIFPAPTAATPLGAGSSTAMAAPDGAAVENVASLAPGQRVVVFGTDAVEILTVGGVAVRDDLAVVTWRAAPKLDFGLAADASDAQLRAYRLGRTFHLFGIDAPTQVVLALEKTPGDPTTTYLATATTDFSLGTTVDDIALDGRYPGLKPGADVLLVVGPTTPGGSVSAWRTTIDEVHDAKAELEALVDPSNPATAVTALTGTVTRLTLDNANTVASSDLRDVVVHELLGEPLRFWPYAYPDLTGTETVCIPGRRAGWSSLEVGRTIEKGRFKPGEVLDLSDLPVGRRVICRDDRGGAPITATVAASTIIGTDVRVGPTATDATTIARLRLDGSQAARTTVLASAPLAGFVTLPATGNPKLVAAIGALPSQTLSLDTSLLGAGTVPEVAAMLEAAIRGALPGAATFANATVEGFEILGPAATGPVLYVAAGVPGDAVAFGPAVDDTRTVTTLGLAPDQVRFVDGFVSGPVDPALIGVAVNGEVRLTYGLADPRNQTVAIPGTTTTVAGVAARIGLLFDDGASWRLRDDNRLLVHPWVPPREVRSFIRLDLAPSGPLALDTTTAVLLGNVAAASHGETVRNELVGDGDAAQAFQRFTLRKSPVTYVPAAVPGGIASSLQLFVNGAQWTEVPTLYGKGPTDEVFASRLADDGTRTIQLGDGVTGARAPSGRTNVVATYRQGIGLAGRVRAGTLTTLLDRPTGLKGVTNPSAADGGADPESLERARVTAPGTVRTFGRAISLRDFEDATLVAGEVAKASAAWVWTGRRRVVHVTVAGQGGATFSPAKLASLAATLDAERDTNHPLLMGNYARVPTTVAATVMVEDRFVAEAVLAAARAALLDALSFERRAFAEAVDLSEVFAVLQGVDGVRAVDVDRLDLKSTDATFRTAHGLDPAKGQLQPRLLTLPARASGTTTVLPAEIAVIEVPPLDVTLRSSGGIVL